MYKTLYGIVFLGCTNFAITWHEIFLTKTQILDSSNAIILRQHDAYARGQAPVVAAVEIKTITIEENNEVLVNVDSMMHPRITMLPTAQDSAPFSSPHCNSGLPKASKVRLGIWQRLEKMVYFLDELASHFGYDKRQVSIKVFEGLRDLDTQKRLFDNKVQEIQDQSPLLTVDQAEQEAAKWVSPYKNNVPVHSTGAAVDIRLWDEYAQDFIDLGKFGVIWGANKEGQTFSENLTNTQKLNRLYLLLAAAKAGLINYPYEYWHFSAGDRYSQFWIEADSSKRIACYGPLKN